MAVPFPPAPAKTLPALNGTTFPPYRVVFEPGECTADDGRAEPVPGSGGSTLIALNKNCFSCFRVPTITAGLTPGVLHAFAEGRRGELTSSFGQYTGSGAGGCPDGPDTRLVYKRSTDYGASWGIGSVFLEQGEPEAEDGRCQSQASAVVDPVTKAVLVGFISNGPGCQAPAINAPYDATPMLVKSMDDGLTWSKPYQFMLNTGPGKPPVPVTAAQHYAIGPTKGMTVRLPGGGVRLMLPGEAEWSASVVSDDHGATWLSNAFNSSFTLSPGEMDWAICLAGSACPAGMKFIMVNRAGGPRSPHSMGVQFSADGTVWSPQVATENGKLRAGDFGHSKPGVVAVAGGVFISSQIIGICPVGVTMNSDMSCGTPGSANYTVRQPSDVLGTGMGLLISRDGVHWQLFKKLWPIGGMYTTAVALTTDAEGAALTYGVLYSAGELPVSKTGTVYFASFTAVTYSGELDPELAAAIAKLPGALTPLTTAAQRREWRRVASTKPPAGAVDIDIPFPVGPARPLPVLDGTGYPPFRVAFQPGECTRNDGSLHPLPPAPAPAPPPPTPGQCHRIQIHHTLGCYNYSDWKQGASGPVFPSYMPSVADKLTLETCAAACFAADPTGLAGVVGGDRCFCGTEANLSSAAAQARSEPKATCETVACRGNPGERGCGGVGTMLAYAYSCDTDPSAAMAASPLPPRRQALDLGAGAGGGRGGGTTLIDVNKTCFSCFRIPTLQAGQSPGVIHAFAEGRRTEMTGRFKQYVGSGAGGCPDGPDTRLVYKRSTDYGASWSAGRVFLEPGDQRAENGLCQSQASAVVDPVTKTLFVGFIANGPGCQAAALRVPYEATPMLVNSTDDGLTWSKPYPFILDRGPGRPVSPASPAEHLAVGPTKGITVRLPGGGARLMLPGEADWSASVISDDHGATWHSNMGNRSFTQSPGEMDWTVCTTATACPPGMKYLMVVRAAGQFHPNVMAIQFSADGVVWTPERPSNNGGVNVGQGHAKPGVVAVAGGAFISSQTLLLCPYGVVVNPDMSCGAPGTPGHRKRQPSDVLGGGMGLMISKDAINWQLFKKTWPIGGMYTTAAALTTDDEGAALTFGIVFAGGQLPVTKTGTIYYMNFTAMHPNGTLDAELAAAIAKL